MKSAELASRYFREKLNLDKQQLCERLLNDTTLNYEFRMLCRWLEKIRYKNK